MELEYRSLVAPRILLAVSCEKVERSPPLWPLSLRSNRPLNDSANATLDAKLPDMLRRSVAAVRRRNGCF